MTAAAQSERIQSGDLSGLEDRYAYVFGIKTNSLPGQGSANWHGDWVGLDANNRVVRGDAELTIDDLTNPHIDVTLTPQGRTAMTWDDRSACGGWPLFTEAPH